MGYISKSAHSPAMRPKTIVPPEAKPMDDLMRPNSCHSLVPRRIRIEISAIAKLASEVTGSVLRSMSCVSGVVRAISTSNGRLAGVGTLAGITSQS